MTTYLEEDPNYEWVACPRCGHEWQIAVGGTAGMIEARMGISCPSCTQQLRFPAPSSGVKKNGGAA